jgi:hypothetical protein
VAGARPWRTARGPGVPRSPPPRSPSVARRRPLGVLPRRGAPARGWPRRRRPSRGVRPWLARPPSPRRGVLASAWRVPALAPSLPCWRGRGVATALARPGARRGVLCPGSALAREACSRPWCGALAARVRDAAPTWRARSPCCLAQSGVLLVARVRARSSVRRGLLVARGAAPARRIPAPAWLAASAPGTAWLAASATGAAMARG